MNYYHHIEDYCEGHLDDSAKADFEQAMQQDASLAGAVAQYASGKKIAEGLIEMDIMETIEGLSSDRGAQPNISKPQNSFTFTKRMKFAIAASFIGLVIISIFFVNSKYSNTSLIKEYAYAPILIENRNETDLSIAQANRLWKEAKWEELISFLNMENQKNKTYFKYLEANAYNKTNQIVKAENTFLELSISAVNPYNQHADWQLVILAIQNHDLEKAEIILEK